MQTSIMISTSSICLHIKFSHEWWNSIKGKVQQTNKPTKVKALTSRVQQITTRAMVKSINQRVSSQLYKANVSNIGFVMVQGPNEGHIRP